MGKLVRYGWVDGYRVEGENRWGLMRMLYGDCIGRSETEHCEEVTIYRPMGH